MQKALAAEREACVAVERQREEAESLMADTRERAKAIAAKGDERVAKVTKLAREAADHALEAIQIEEAERLAQVAVAMPDTVLVRQAVQYLAKRLTGNASVQETTIEPDG
jgi:uncharacterized protein YciW